MATIKEVALHAGVSVGTVSNVLNGKTDNVELIAKVENAISELNYRPDINARNLKITKTNTVALVIPNTVKPSIVAMLGAIEAGLQRNGYSLILNVSQNNVYVERKCIEQCLEKRVDGIIVIACESDPKYYKRFENENIPIVYIDESMRLMELNADVIGINYKEALQKVFEENKERELGIIFEQNMIDSEELEKIYLNYYEKAERIKIIDYSEERGFKAAFELLSNHKGVEILVASNYLIAKAAKKAAKLLEREDVAHICVKERQWLEDDGEFSAMISVPYGDIADVALRKIKDAAKDPANYEAVSVVVKAGYVPNTSSLIDDMDSTQKNTTLNLYMLDSPATQALDMLAQVYTRKTGIQINVDSFPYSMLEENLYTLFEQKKSNIDIVMMDIIWMEEMQRTGGLHPLGNMIDDKKRYLKGFEGLEGIYDDTFYGLPFVSGAQILLYQRDLFEDHTVNMQYKRKYGSPLEIPDTWAKFNLTAEFFTKEYNEKSPVNYGFAAVRGVNAYTSLMFLNRLWAYKSDIFEDDKVIINSPNALMALKSFVKSYKYSDMNSPGRSWDDVIKEFKKGDCAMAVTYDSHAIDINDYSKSKVAGNIGFALIPGRKPVLGGWYLGLNSNGKQKREAMDFMIWACSNKVSIPYSLLGGTSLRMGSYERSDLDNIYPWKDIVAESYRISSKRQFSKKQNPALRRSLYTHLIPEELERVLNGFQTEEQTLENIEHRIKQLQENDSYTL